MRPATSRRTGGFTMVEVIAVMTIITIFAGLVGYAFMRGGGSSISLQSAQTTLIGLLNHARSHAAMTGRDTGVFLQIETTGVARDLAYRYIVVAEDTGSSWRAVTAPVLLPTGCYALKHDAPPGFPAFLESTAFPDSEGHQIDRTESYLDWVGSVFTPRGTKVGNSGKIVLCSGQPEPPDTPDPVRFLDPQNVRGAMIYTSGLVRAINDQAGFETN